MSERKITALEDRVPVMRVTMNKTGDVYELDFNREAIRFAEARGFELDSVTKFPVTKIPELFYYAFRKNHKNVSKTKTDSILETMGGLTGPMLERLIQLYNQASLTHVISTEEDMEKNSETTVEL